MSPVSCLLSPVSCPIKRGGINIYIIDRIEGDRAVIEAQAGMFNVPLWLLPRGAREGDVLSITIHLDQEATKKRKEEAAGLAQRLFKD